jgi:YbbR domain-containing protein
MKNLITHNLGLKISALLISALLWFFVTSRGQSEMSMEIPIEYKNIPVGLGIVSSSHKTASVHIRGQERLMKNIKSSDIRVSVDLGKAKKGDGSLTLHVSKDDIKLPHTMSVTSVSPSSLKVRIDETFTKVVPVTPVLTGSPEKGFSVRSVEVDPSSITVRGLKAEVRKISDLRTEALDITGLKETTSQNLDIDTLGANINLDKNSARVKVTIAGRKK